MSDHAFTFGVGCRGDRKSLLAARTLFDEGGDQRKRVSHLHQDAGEIPFDRTSLAAACFLLMSSACVAPDCELRGDRLLQGLATSEVDGAASSGPDEVRLVEREALGQCGNFDE